MASEETKQKKLIAALLAIFLGGFGAHKFYLGYMKAGIVQLVVSLITCGSIGSLIGLIEGIMYFTKSDDDFESVYINGDKNQMKFRPIRRQLFVVR